MLKVAAAVGVLSDSSSESGSDSSSDSSESDSDDSDLDDTHIPNERNITGNPIAPKESMSLPNSSLAHLSMPSHLLSEDLRLSDSGSESD